MKEKELQILRNKKIWSVIMMENKKEYGNNEGTLAAAYESTACTSVQMQKETIELITSGQMPDGDVLNKARVAGIFATRKSQEILPLVPPLADDAVKVTLMVRSADKVDISATTTSTTQDNANKVSMMVASMTALSLYNLCNTVDKQIKIGDVTSL